MNKVLYSLVIYWTQPPTARQKVMGGQLDVLAPLFLDAALDHAVDLLAGGGQAVRCLFAHAAALVAFHHATVGATMLALHGHPLR